MSDCYCCKMNVPAERPRVCPACGHVFQGNGWDGIDAHWRSRHRPVMSYGQFWSTMCEEHRGGPPKHGGSSARERFNIPSSENRRDLARTLFGGSGVKR